MYHLNSVFRCENVHVNSVLPIVADPFYQRDIYIAHNVSLGLVFRCSQLLG